MNMLTKLNQLKCHVFWASFARFASFGQLGPISGLHIFVFIKKKKKKKKKKKEWAL